MTFLAPLHLLWGLLALPIVALHMIRGKRRRRVVSSLLLWRMAERQLATRTRLQKLQPRLSLLLQLLAVAIGTLALARPVFGVPDHHARICVVIDTSASMAAQDAEGRTAIAQAQALVREWRDALPEGSTMMIIEAGELPVVRTEFLRPGAQDGALGRAIDGLAVRGVSADLVAAVGLASSRVGTGTRSEVRVVTDGFGDEALPVGGEGIVQVTLVGQPAANVAIVGAHLAEGAGSEEASEGRRRTLFVQLEAFADEVADEETEDEAEGEAEDDAEATEQNLYVQAFDASERLVASRRVALRRQATVRLHPSSDAEFLHVRLAAEDGPYRDAFPMDDTAAVLLPPSGPLRIRLVGQPSPAVTRVFRADPSLVVERNSLQAYREALAGDGLSSLAVGDGELAAGRGRLPDLWVFFGEVPPEPPPGDSLVIAPTADEVFEFALGPEVEGPAIAHWREEDARLRFLSLEHTLLGRSRSVVGGESLITALHGDVAQSITRPSGETTLLAFAPEHGDWAQDASFVVFFRNVVERVRRHREEGRVRPAPLGALARVPAVDGQGVSVRTPSGQNAQGTGHGGEALVPIPAEVGLYVAEVDGTTTPFVRNLFAREESRLHRRLRSASGALEVREDGALPSEEDALHLLALVLLALLLIESAWASRSLPLRRAISGAGKGRDRIGGKARVRRKSRNGGASP